jgi:predicted nucleotidyltransferase
MPSADLIPPTVRQFLEEALPILRGNSRLLGVAAGGSYAHGRMDRYSDLDLLLVTTNNDAKEIVARLPELAQAIGPLLSSFSGSMFGVPELLVCLYAPQPLHVDLKVVAIETMRNGIERPEVLFDRTGELRACVAAMTVAWPDLCAQWFEDRFWIWVDYVVRKVGRGEIFDALDCLAMIRKRVLGPMIARHLCQRQDEVRHIERVAPELSEQLKAVIGRHDAGDLLRALDAAILLYTELRRDEAPEKPRDGAEAAARAAVKSVAVAT